MKQKIENNSDWQNKTSEEKILIYEDIVYTMSDCPEKEKYKIEIGKLK